MNPLIILGAGGFARETIEKAMYLKYERSQMPVLWLVSSESKTGQVWLIL